MSEVILAAGAVLWRAARQEAPAGDEVEVLLVHRPKYDDWSLPKGKRDPGEHVLLTAVREVFEETSVRPVLGPRLHTAEYLASGRPKQVYYWSASGPGYQAAPSHEIDAVSWLPLPQARERLSYAHDAEVVSGLRPRETVPLVLVRHASAGHKDDWAEDDLLRPLDALGALDARRLADLLACFAPRARVISSPAMRCVETVRPYAAGFGASVEVEDGLAAPDRAGDFFMTRTDSGDTLGQLFRDLVAAGQPTVVCLHRENLREALTAVCSALGAPAPVTDSDPSLPKGGFWVVHAAAGELAGLERYAL